MAAAARSLYIALSRNARRGLNTPLRGISSSSEAVSKESSTSSNDLDGAGFVEEEKDDLKSRISRLRLPKRSATNVLQKWINEGNKIPISELRSICNDLRRSRGFKHALEISEWMVSHEEYELLDTDYAIRINLMTKVFGIDAAERYFEALPPSAKTSATYTALLHCYAGSKLTEKVEEFFERIRGVNIPLTAITYDELMTFYISVGQLEKVPQIVEEMRCQNIALNLFSYNLWLTSQAAALNMDEVRNILNKMAVDSNSNQIWVRYMKLAKIYISSSHLVNPDSSSLMDSEKAVTQRQLISYDLLFILYGGLGDKLQLNRIWRNMRTMTGRNYICILSSYLMLGHVQEVGEIAEQWKQSATSEFNLSMCKKLMEAYHEAGMVDKATDFYMILKQKGYDLATE